MCTKSFNAMGYDFLAAIIIYLVIRSDWLIKFIIIVLELVPESQIQDILLLIL